jgi:hypothetical protein
MNDRLPARDDVALLLEYLRSRDVPCPRCGYDLRDLAQPRCPECREELSLAVGFRKPRFGWFLVTVIPGFFSGMCAGFLVIPIFFFNGGGPRPWQILVADGFGWTSGLVALGLVRWRHAFLQWPEKRQRGWAIALWTVHVVAFFTLFALRPR